MTTPTPPHLAYHTFKRPFVRDLAFALACPTVLTQWLVNHSSTSPIHLHDNQFWQQQFSAYKSRLIHLDSTSDYQQLTKFLINRPSPHRLGFHFEGLMLFWLLDGFSKGVHPFEVLAHNLQIFDGDKTLGELDFILKNHQTNEVEHWELAIKFFLGHPPFTAENWIGINSKDNLQRKMTHMIQKPFQQEFVITQDGQTHTIDKRYAVIKGRFFKPQDAEFCYPNWLNPSFPMHIWHTWHSWHTEQDIEQIKASYCPHAYPIDDCAIYPANYIEWFTPRSFYHTKRKQIATAINSTDITTGLYFLVCQQSVTPLIIRN